MGEAGARLASRLTARLQSLPESFAATREALHQVAERIVAPARKPENEIALTATPGGFGTPEFEFEGAVHQVRVAGAELVHERNREARRTGLSSLARAAELLGPELLPGGHVFDAEPLAIDRVSAARLADLYDLAAGVLGEFSATMAAAEDPSAVILWPEHFDIALEAGSEADGLRATYGASPGDADHQQPYFYVGPWVAPPAGRIWNAHGFSGAELDYSELLDSADPAAAAGEFLRACHEALAVP